MRKLFRGCFVIAFFLPFLAGGTADAQSTRAEKIALIAGLIESNGCLSPSPKRPLACERVLTKLAEMCESSGDEFKFCDFLPDLG